MEEKQKYEEKRNNQKQNVLLILGVLAIIGIFGGLTYAFFNYTRTGTANNIRTGMIYFNTEEGNALTLTNVFPMTSTEARPTISFCLSEAFFFRRP